MAAVAFASASAATSAVFQSLAPGDHVVAPTDAYFGTGKLLRRHGMRSHNLEKKSSKRRRGFRKLYGVAESDVKGVKKLLRGG